MKDLEKFDFGIIQSALENSTDEPVDPIESPIENTENPPIEDPNPPISNDSPLYKFAKVLQEEGFFSEDDLEGFDGSLDGLVERTAKIADKIAEHKTTNYTPSAKQFVDMLNNGVSEEVAKDIVNRSIALDKITDDILETDVETQKFVIRKQLEGLQMSPEEIEEQITYFEDTDRLFTKSYSAFSKLKEGIEREKDLAKEQARLQAETVANQNKKTLEDIKEKVYAMKEFMPGMNLSDTMKEKVYNKLTTPAQVIDGVPISHVGAKRMKDPVQFEITLNILDELGVFDGKFDKLLSMGKRRSAEELEQSISTSDFFNKNNQPSTPGKISEEIVNSLKELPNFKI